MNLGEKTLHKMDKRPCMLITFSDEVRYYKLEDTGIRKLEGRKTFASRKGFFKAACGVSFGKN